MKVIILVAIFIFANAISSSNSAYCPCLCCLKDPNNDDCASEFVGNVNITSCSGDQTICKTRCEEQFPTQCGANNSLVDSNCVSGDTTTLNPTPATTSFNGPVQCKCECCPVTPCNATVQGNVIVDKCADCASGCAQQYPSACGPPATVAAATCEPAPSTETTAATATATATATPTPTQPPANTTEPSSSAFILGESPSLIALLITSILTITKLIL